MTSQHENDAAGTEPVPVEQLSYTAASRELDSIVAFFEQREVDVDQLVTRLERATAIVDELDRRIRRTRTQVEELVPRLEAAAEAATAGPGRGPERPASGRKSDGVAEEDDEDEFEDESMVDDDLDEEAEVWDDDDDDVASPEPARQTDQPLF